MIHLRKRVLSLLLHSPSRVPTHLISPLFPLHRLSTTTPIAPNAFAVEDYLVANCGLSRAKALKASKKLSHLKSPSKPDAVLDFLAGLGLSRADVATVVSNDPLFLCADVEKTLAPRVLELTDLGLSRAEMARLVVACQSAFRRTKLRSNVEFWLSVSGSFESFLQLVKVNSCLLSNDLEKVTKPNLAFLQRCGISVTDLSGTGKFTFRMLTRSSKHLEEALARVDEFGISRTSWAFPHVLSLFAIFSREKLAKNLQMFEKLGLSKVDIALALSRSPHLVGLTEERARRNLEFLMGDVGLDIPYIACRPVLFMYSLERRLLPRHCLINLLKAKGLPIGKFSFYSIAVMGEEKFLREWVHPYEKSVPGLTAAYASSRDGKPQWEQLDETEKEKIKS